MRESALQRAPLPVSWRSVVLAFLDVFLHRLTGLNNQARQAIMKVAAVTELKNKLSHYLRMVARGETVTVLDRGKPVAQITPLAVTDEGLRRLAAEGVVRLPVRPVPRDFWKRRLPHSSASVSEALAEERADRVG